MKLSEFLRKLKTAKKKGYKAKYKPEGIRLYDKDGFEFCPVTCVANIMGYCKHGPAYWGDSAKNIGLLQPLDIVTAADIKCKRLSEKDDKVHLDIRKKMIKAIFGTK